MIVPCKIASSLISKSFDQPLSFSERIQVKIHLFLCQYVGGSDCENYQKQISFLRELAGHSSEKVLSLRDVEKLKLSVEQKRNLKTTLTISAKGKA